jgi:hypothetical protein
MLLLLLELRPTTFGTPPLSKGWGRPEPEKPRRQNDTRLEIRLNYPLYTNTLCTYLYFKSLNKLLVLPNTTINFGPSTQREQLSTL